MKRIGIEFLTVLGLPPLDFVKLAASLDCRHISLPLGPSPVNPHGHPPFDLVADAPLRRELAAALRDHGVSISLGEGYVIREGSDIRDVAAVQFEPMLALGIRRINAVSMEPDLGRTLDQYAVLAELAEAAGFEVVCEFAPVMTLRDLPAALAAVRHVGRDNFRLLIDTMHFGRTGGAAAELAALDPALVGYIQLSDVALVPSIPDYMHEAMHARLTPGEGELPLREILAALPRDRIVGVEVPQVDKAIAGRSTTDIVRAIVHATRVLLDGLPSSEGPGDLTTTF